MNHSFLKAKQRQLRGGFNEDVSLRIHRAISWLGRAEAETEDDDVRFILLWIGFNAAYASDIAEEMRGERVAFRSFFEVLVALDKTDQIHGSVWKRFSQEIRILLDNPYVFAPFWDCQNGIEGYEDWEARLTASKKVAANAIMQKDTVKILTILFDRLYVLRNQLVHGGATWNGNVNRNQVRDGAAILATLLPIFINLMLEGGNRQWGKPFYPVVSS